MLRSLFPLLVLALAPPPAALAASASSKGSASPGYGGFALGMTKTEALSLLRQLGFADWFDIDKSTRNGQVVPRTKLVGLIEEATEKSTKDKTVKHLPCVMSRPLSRQNALAMDCGFKTSPLEKLFRLALHFHEERLERLDVYFHGAEGKTTIKELRDQLGPSWSEGPAAPLLETSGHSVEQLGCRDLKCRMSGWRKKRGGRNFLVTVVSRDEDPNEGRAVSLHVTWSEDVRTASKRAAKKRLAE